jgi:microcystin-dependent protein
MADQFVGEVKLFAIGYAPRGWAFCDGQLMSISQNPQLFSLLQVYYGGDGRTTFALPDLRGKVAVHTSGGAPFNLGNFGGETTHTLAGSEMPVSHNHTIQGSQDVGVSNTATGMVLANASLNVYAPPSPAQQIVSSTIADLAAGQPHENMSPFQSLSFCIALQGIYPSRP